MIFRSRQRTARTLRNREFLASSLGGPNPTLTTQALATRTAEQIFVRYFGGDTWVTTESPICSTDRRASPHT